MTIKNIIFFFNKLKIALLRKQLTFSINNFSYLETILESLYTNYYIAGFNKINEKETKIYLRYDVDGNSIIKEINFVSKKNNQKTLQQKNIKKLQSFFPYSLGFILTRNGIFDTKQTLNIGGEFIVFIK